MAKVTSVPLKGVTPGWLGEEETPSSQISVSQAQGDHPRRQQPFPVSWELQGLLAQASLGPTGGSSPENTTRCPRNGSGESATAVMALALECWFG